MACSDASTEVQAMSLPASTILYSKSALPTTMVESAEMTLKGSAMPGKLEAPKCQGIIITSVPALSPSQGLVRGRICFEQTAIPRQRGPRSAPGAKKMQSASQCRSQRDPTKGLPNWRSNLGHNTQSGHTFSRWAIAMCRARCSHGPALYINMWPSALNEP